MPLGSFWVCTLQHVLFLYQLTVRLGLWWGTRDLLSVSRDIQHVFFLHLALNPWKLQRHHTEDFHAGRQKKFPTKMVKNLTNLTLSSAEVTYSLFGTCMYIRQTFVLLACSGSECIPRHLTAWYIEMNDGLGGAGGTWGLWEQHWVIGEGSCLCSNKNNAFGFTI